jgi:hypothetical protein
MPSTFGQQFQMPAASPSSLDVDMSDGFDDFMNEATDEMPGLQQNAVVPAFYEVMGFHPYVAQEAPGPASGQPTMAEVD